MAGVFPYLELCAIFDRGGTALMTGLPVTKYDGGQFASSTGEQYEATGYCPATPLAVETLIGSANLRLELDDGTVYGVVSAAHHQVVGYIELGLQRNLPR